jgi:4-amino-4-deoxy-L-arabinose transferase-like glycosyltransferase
MTDSAPPRPYQQHRLRFFAVVIVIVTVLLRLPALVHPNAIDDEAVYSVVGNAIADGGRPYIDAVERKPPLLFWTYAAIARLGGEYNWVFLHTFALLWVLATMAGLYVIGRRLFNPATGLFAAFLYGLFGQWAAFINLAFNGEVAMNLAIVWAWAVGLSPGRSRWRPELMLSGAFFCAAFLLKQPAAVSAIPLGMYLLSPAHQREQGTSWATSFLQAALLTIGFFGTLGITALVLQRQQILQEAIYWTLLAHAVPMVFWRKATLHTLAFIAACLPVVVGSILSCRSRSIWKGREAERFALIALVAASAIGTAAGGRFYPHYYIQLIPPLVLLAAPFFAELFFGRTSPGTWFLTRPIVALWLAGMFVGFSISQWVGGISRRPLSEAGPYVRNHSDPNDRIFVWGQDADIYLEAQRRPACRYVVTFPLTGLIFGGVTNIDTHDRIVPGAWENLNEDFERHPPEYIVAVDDDPKNAQYPIGQFPVLKRWLEQYEVVKRTAEGTIYRRTK